MLLPHIECGAQWQEIRLGESNSSLSKVYNATFGFHSKYSRKLLECLQECVVTCL